jgi:hypothetical protein
VKFCQPHWDRLKASVESRGMGHLIAANGRDAHARAVADLEGRSDLSDFDPLMACHNRIVQRATEQFGLYLYTGDYCPVCETVKNFPKISREETEDHYSEKIADSVLEFCRSQGLVT